MAPTVAKGYLRQRKVRDRELPRLNLDSDNEAQLAWRQGQKPNAVLRLPESLDLSTIAVTLQKIATTTHTYIVPAQIRQARTIIELRVWGNSSQCRIALAEINAWIERTTVRHGPSKSFSKVRAYTEQDEINDLLKLRAEERRQKYRQQRPADDHKKFAHIMILKWAETDWSPFEILGQQMEAIDPIRMDSLCYIEYLRTNTNISGGPCFILHGNKDKKMRAAVERLQNIDKQIMACRSEDYKFSGFLVKPIVTSTPIDYSKYAIRLEGHTGPTYINALQVSNDQGQMTMNLETRNVQHCGFLSKDEETVTSIENIESGSFRLGHVNARRLNEQYISLWLMSALEFLPYYSGYLKMRARLGTCVFTNYKTAKDGLYGLEQFEEMLETANTQDSQLEAYFPSELGNKVVEPFLWQVFFSRRDLFRFRDAAFVNAPPEKCHPVYSAVFHIEGVADQSDYRLEVSFKEDRQGGYYKEPLRWLRLDKGEKDLTKMVDISLIDLQNRYTSYNLSISGSQILNKAGEAKLPLSYINFAENVDLDLATARKIGEGLRFIKYPTLANVMTLPVRQMEQRRSWLFNILNSPNYVAEVYTTQIAEFDNGGGGKPREVRCGVQVWHEEWDLLFNENQSLTIGQRANWEPSEWQFFPSHGQMWSEDRIGLEFENGIGIEELINVMDAVAGAVKSGAKQAAAAAQVSKKGEQEAVSARPAASAVGGKAVNPRDLELKSSKSVLARSAAMKPLPKIAVTPGPSTNKSHVRGAVMNNQPPNRPRRAVLKQSTPENPATSAPSTNRPPRGDLTNNQLLSTSPLTVSAIAKGKELVSSTSDDESTSGSTSLSSQPIPEPIEPKPQRGLRKAPTWAKLTKKQPVQSNNNLFAFPTEAPSENVGGGYDPKEENTRINNNHTLSFRTGVPSKNSGGGFDVLGEEEA